MGYEGHQPLAPRCVLGSSELVTTNWFWDRALYHLDEGHYCTVIFCLSILHPRRFLVRGLTNVFVSLFGCPVAVVFLPAGTT